MDREWNYWADRFDDQTGLQKDGSFIARDRTWYVSSRDMRSKREYPYSYSPFFIWREENLKGANADYDDRLSQWNRAKFSAARNAVKERRFRHYSKKDASKFLSEYYGKPLKAVALVEGCNVSNGYEYFVFYYRDVVAKAEQDEKDK